MGLTTRNIFGFLAGGLILARLACARIGPSQAAVRAWTRNMFIGIDTFTPRGIDSLWGKCYFQWNSVSQGIRACDQLASVLPAGGYMEEMIRNEGLRSRECRGANNLVEMIRKHLGTPYNGFFFKKPDPALDVAAMQSLITTMRSLLDEANPAPERFVYTPAHVYENWSEEEPCDPHFKHVYVPKDRSCDLKEDVIFMVEIPESKGVCSNGACYDADSLDQWLETQGSDPTTRLPLPKNAGALALSTFLVQSEKDAEKQSKKVLERHESDFSRLSLRLAQMYVCVDFEERRQMVSAYNRLLQNSDDPRTYKTRVLESLAEETPLRRFCDPLHRLPPPKESREDARNRINARQRREMDIARAIAMALGAHVGT